MRYWTHVPALVPHICTEHDLKWFASVGSYGSDTKQWLMHPVKSSQMASLYLQQKNAFWNKKVPRKLKHPTFRCCKFAHEGRCTGCKCIFWNQHMNICLQNATIPERNGSVGSEFSLDVVCIKPFRTVNDIINLNMKQSSCVSLIERHHSKLMQTAIYSVALIASGTFIAIECICIPCNDWQMRSKR